MLPSIIRTVVPWVMGWLITALALIDVTITDDQQASLRSLLQLVITALYYGVARLLEQHFPWASWLLGSTKQPTYVGRHREEEGQ